MGGNKITRVEEMPVYQLFYALALAVEGATRQYGPDFRWLRNQSLRASESVPSNLTEGFYAQYSTEYLQSLFRCRREAREVLTHLKYAGDVGLLAQDAIGDLSSRYEDALQQLSMLIASLEKKIERYGKSKTKLSVHEELGEYIVETSP